MYNVLKFKLRNELYNNLRSLEKFISFPVQKDDSKPSWFGCPIRVKDESPISREGIGGLIFLVFFFTYWIVNFKTDYSKKYYYLGYTFKIIFCVIIICVIAIYAYGSPEQKGPQYGFNSLFTNRTKLFPL